MGYDGFYDAANYIKSYWASIGLDLHEETFNIVAPTVEKCLLTIEVPNGPTIEATAYPLWPNHVNPSPYTSPSEGDRTVYVGRGLPEDFNGVDTEGAFILMEFNNRWYWKNAAIFGAKGVIFLEPDETVVTQSVQKTFSIPINFPRLYVNGETAQLLKQLALTQGEVRVWIESRMVWQQKEVANIVAVIEGTDEALRNEVAVIGAYYDSWCVVPQISPGTTDSTGVSFLLELGRLLAETPPRRTVWLVAFAGHYQALAGGREFVENHFNELENKLKMMISLDLASDSDVVAAYAAGSMYAYNRPQDFLRYYDGWMKRIFNQWLPAVELELGEEAHLIDGVLRARPSWVAASPPFEPFIKYFEAEVFTEACYGGGLGFITTNAFRIYQHTPLDTFDRIKPENLRRQVIFLWPVLYNSANMEVDFPLYPRRAGAIDHGLVSVTVQLSAYNKTTDWFDDYAHEDALFLISVGPTMNPVGSIVAAGYSPSSAVGPSRSVVVQGVTAGLFAAPPPPATGGIVTAALGTSIGFTTIMKPDAEGKVVLKGIKPLTGIDAQGYVLDPEDGRILSATDTGPFGIGKIRLGTLFGAASSAAAPTLTPGMGGAGYLRGTGVAARAFAPNVAQLKRDVPIFNVSSIALLGLFDPWRISDPQGLVVEVYNFLSHSYFVWRDTLEPWPEAMVFVKPDAASELIVRGSQNRVVAVFNNASKDNPQGQGYWLGHGESVVLTILDAARDTFHLADLRGGFLMAKMSSNPKLVLYLERLYGLKQLAEEASGNENKGELYKPI
ncbi:MAG: M28 family peptidase, partial [Candidatus Bathyarchaeota archaeon]|nr:M28 family peptidase [Candidatus Bathyarchaeota archaeon]